jgi:hypothetical protein
MGGGRVIVVRRFEEDATQDATQAVEGVEGVEGPITDAVLNRQSRVLDRLHTTCCSQSSLASYCSLKIMRDHMMAYYYSSQTLYCIL